MSQKIEARRGQLVPLKFIVQSVDRTTTINVRSVALKQTLDGTILPDTDAVAPDSLRILSASQIKLTDNESQEIKCRLRVPTNKSNFHSFGLLMTDLGRIVDKRSVRGADNKERRVGIRFVTQYLLRVDVSIKNSRGEDAKKIEIESVNLVEEGGFAQAQVFVSNPTDSPLEFQARATLLRGGRQVGKNVFNLVMPNRASMESVERNDIRILPNARIRLEEMLPEAIFPGQHEMQVDIRTNRRSRKKDTYPITINLGDFPAQDAAIAQAARDVTVSPAQVQLSMRRGGKRRASLEIQNNTANAITVTLAPSPGESFPKGFVLRPDKVSIRAGSKRKILTMLDTRKAVPVNTYSQVAVTVTNGAGEALGDFEVPIALLARSEEKPEVEIGEIRWDGESQPPAFVLPMNNRGQMHLPVNATLKMVDAFGREVEMKAGYGRWLLPHRQLLLRFRTKFAPPAGTYQYQVKVDGTESMESIELSDQLTLGTPESSDELTLPTSSKAVDSSIK